MQPKNEMRSPLCGVAEAIHMLARQPREAPVDPCRGIFNELPQHQRSRWILTYLPVLRVLVTSKGDGFPSAPNAWCELEPRLGLRSARSLWPTDLEAIWRSRVEAMRGHCDATDAAAAVWVARWAPYEAAALAHLEACEMRNSSLIEAAAQLLRFAIAADGPMMVGCDTRTRRVGEIPRALLFDPTAQWVTDAEAGSLDATIVFTGGLRTSKAEFIDITFAVADIDALLTAVAPRAALPQRNLSSVVRRAALEVFPGGPPPGMSVRTRDDEIIAKMVEMGARKPSARTIRVGLSGLWAPAAPAGAALSRPAPKLVE